MVFIDLWGSLQAGCHQRYSSFDAALSEPYLFLGISYYASHEVLQQSGQNYVVRCGSRQLFIEQRLMYDLASLEKWAADATLRQRAVISTGGYRKIHVFV